MQKVNNKNFDNRLDDRTLSVTRRSSVLGSDGDALEPRTVSDQDGILETEAGLSPTDESQLVRVMRMGWDAATGSQAWTKPVSLEEWTHLLPLG